jgi:hypothetical protein
MAYLNVMSICLSIPTVNSDLTNLTINPRLLQSIHVEAFRHVEDSSS